MPGVRLARATGSYILHRIEQESYGNSGRSYCGKSFTAECVGVTPNYEYERMCTKCESSPRRAAKRAG